MRPEAWGKAMWQTMHAVALGYPKEPTEYQKLAYRSFYASLGEVIPCGPCAASYRRMMHKHGGMPSLDAALEAGAGPKSCGTSPLFDWTVRVHNATNAELGKPSNWTPERARTSVLRGGLESTDTPNATSPHATSPHVLSATWKAMAVGFTFAAVLVFLCVILLRLTGGIIRTLLA